MFYGNLINRIQEGPTKISPLVGMGVTISMYSDRHAATIIEVKGRRVAVQEDISIRTDKNGMSESQSYDYFSDTSAPIRWFSKRKDGSFVEVNDCTKLILNYRDTYYDYSF